MAASMKIFGIDDDQTTVTITPLVDLSDYLFEGLQAETRSLLAALDEPSRVNVIVDFCNTTYFGSDFLGVLIKLWKRVQPRGGKMALCNLTRPEKEVIGICELDKLWSICSSAQEARRAVAGADA